MKLDNLPTKLLLLCLLASCSSTKKEKSIIAAPTLPEETILENAISTYDQSLYRISLQNWTDLKDGYPTSYYSTFAELKLADTNFFSGEYPAALVSYEEFAKLHPGHEAMPYVRYQIGNCHLKQYKGIKHDQAPLKSSITAFQQLIEAYPRSEYVVLARRQLLHCRELQAAYERYVANFYEKRGFDEAANSRLSALTENFPDSQVAIAAQPKDEEPKPVPATTGGKSPSAPKVVEKSGLEGRDYEVALERIRGSKSDVHEEDLATSESVKSKTEPEKPALPSPLESFDCEETESGAVFTVALNAAVKSLPEKNENDKLVFNFSETQQFGGTEDSCSAGGKGLRVTADSQKVTIISSDADLSGANVLVLNRPDRIVVSISK